MMKEDITEMFGNRMSRLLENRYTLRWETDKKGVVCGWCKLADPGDIGVVAGMVADLKGRVMTISPLITKENEKSEHIEINYHFYFMEVNCTVCITLSNGLRRVESITTVLKSADWHEREMRELYNIELQGHPNPKKLFLDESIRMTDHTMIPLSEAMSGASTSTLWERIMSSRSREAKKDE